MKNLLLAFAAFCCGVILASCSQAPKRVLPSDAPGAMTQEGDRAATGQTPPYLAGTSPGPSPAEVGADTVTPSLAFLNNRLYDYGQKLDRYKELDAQSAGANLSPAETEQMVTCFKNLRQVIDRYNAAQATVLHGGDGALDSSEMMALQSMDIEFME
ncbi:MAG: hypothetical protein ACK5PS_09285, partial [Desulfopila sp.]